MQEGSFIVRIQQTTILVPRKITLMSGFLHNILSLGFQDEQIPIQLISEQTFKTFINFCELNDFKEPIINTPIKTNDMSQILDEKNYNFIKEFNILSEQLHSIVKAAQFLDCKGLLRVCSVPFACLIYFKDSKQAYLKKCEELKISSSIQYEDQQKFKKIYPFLNH